MSFKQWTLPLFAVIFVATTGCSDWIDGRKSKPGVVEVSDSTLVGLNKLPQLLTDFINGDAKEADIREGVSALRTAFIKFRTRFTGSKPDAYSPDDMRKFFEKYFVKQTPITTQLAEQFFLLKVALFGGDSQWMTGEEVDKVVKLLVVLEDEAVKIEPYMKVLLAQEQTQVTSDQITAATSQLQSSTLKLWAHVALKKSDYTYQNLNNLIHQLGLFAARSNHFDIFAIIENWTPVAADVKVILFGKDADLNTPDQWKNAIQTMIEIGELGLRYHYLMASSSYNDPNDVDQTLDFLDRGLALVENCPQMKSNGKIPFANIDHLINLLTERKWFPLSVSADALTDLYHVIVNMILDPARPRSASANFIAPLHIHNFRREFNIFRSNENIIETAMTGYTFGSVPGLAAGLKKSSIDTVVKQFVTAPADVPAVKDGVLKFQQLLQKKRPIMFTQTGRVLIVAAPEKQVWSWKSLTRANLMFFLTRMLLMGYGDDVNPTISGMSSDGFTQWVTDFQKFGTAIHAFDPRTGNSGARSYNEATYFTYGGVSQGPHGPHLAMDETYEYVSILIAGGMENGQAMQDWADKHECDTNQLDLFENYYIKEDCFSEQLRNNFPKFFDNLPGLTTEINRMKILPTDSVEVRNAKDTKWASFYKSLSIASRDPFSLPGLLDTSDIRTMAMIVHYAETLFIIYDLNRDNILQETEIRAASGRFTEIVRPFCKPVDYNWVIEDAFVSLVVLGRIPTYKDVASIVKLEMPYVGKPTADRMNIFTVFANMMNQIQGQ